MCIHSFAACLEIDQSKLSKLISVFSYQVMQALVQHYSQHGWLERVEQCVLHMDIASLDFNQVHFSPYNLLLGGRPIS